MAAGPQFPIETAGLPDAVSPEIVTLASGASYHLRIAPVAKQVGAAKVRMLAYNGSIPGPTLKVREGSEVEVVIENQGDTEATVHWHGLRLENRYDGTHETQRPLDVGEQFTARLSFPDPGIYWYHPHVREDYNQELGLYGSIIVEPGDPDYWPPAHRELTLTLDDLLIEDGRIGSFKADQTTHSAMGRFGNVLLVSGEVNPTLEAAPGEVVRLFLTNTANTRVFNVAVPDARMKLVGADSGRVEHEQFVEAVRLAPSERAVVDVQFEGAGPLAMEHRTPEETYEIATFEVGGEPVVDSVSEAFPELRTNADIAALRTELASAFSAEPDKSLVFTAELDMGEPEGEGPVSYSCPMHPEVVSAEPGHCPKCGMKLMPADPAGAETSSHEPSGHGDHAHHHEHDSPEGGNGIEWEDEMVEMNRMTTSQNMLWKIVDQATGAANTEIDWRFRVGERIKLRLFNEMAGDHPMHHPFHVHGAGRFLILTRDGVEEPNLVWKDTVLVRAGETVDIMLELTHRGRWMAHCHIAEHHESGMHFSFDVDPA